MTEQKDIVLLEKLGEMKSKFLQEISKSVIGQQDVLNHILIALLCRGHTLIVGVPGLAKTLIIKSMAELLDLNFKRIQFTPDLMPSDITGTEVIDDDKPSGKRSFRFFKGPIFGNIILADEINRTPPKTQSALLEAMQEHQVTIGDTTYPLPEPFLVLATENPIDQEGTYPLPEAQVDRFMLKLKVGYPSKDDERAILDRMSSTAPNLNVDAVTTLDAISEARKLVNDVFVDPKIRDYIVDLILATRDPEQYKLKLSQYIQFGASPRATISLTLAAKAWALMQGRAYVVPQDLKEIGMDVLRHRVIPSYEAEAEEISSEDLVTSIFDAVPVP